MPEIPYLPIFELTRGNVVECIHWGSIAVADRNGRLAAWYGDPDAVTFLRSSAKPFQALPFIEHEGAQAFNLTLREVAIICASHSGTDDHLQVIESIQAKTGVHESDLLCGTHPPGDRPTAEALLLRGEQPSPNRHNCSGKHTGMLAYTRLLARHQSLPAAEYIDPNHPIQKEILGTFASMCSLQPEAVELGTDGCSAPNFAVPLRNAAIAFARLCDPQGLSEERARACRLITSAMTSNPDMVGGPGKFDTELMQVGQGRIVCKGGAEGYQAIGLLPGTLGPDSPALGITLKIADGDARDSARHAVALEVLRQLGALTSHDLEQLHSYGPGFPVLNWRKLHVGDAYPTFTLKRTD